MELFRGCHRPHLKEIVDQRLIYKTVICKVHVIILVILLEEHMYFQERCLQKTLLVAAPVLETNNSRPSADVHVRRVFVGGPADQCRAAPAD